MLPVLATDTVTNDAARATGYALLWGLEGVALRTVSGSRVPFINEAPVRRRLDADDLPVACVDPGLFEGAPDSRASWMNDVAAFDDTAAFCRRMGCRLVRVGALGQGDTHEPRVEALRALGDAAQRHGLRLAVRNERDTAVATGAKLAALLTEIAHPAVLADWHPSDALASGEAVLDGLGALLAGNTAIGCVAVTDEALADDGVPVPVPVGDGRMEWPEQLRRLAEARYDGPLVLSVPDRPVGPAGLASGGALVRLARQARRAAAAL